MPSKYRVVTSSTHSSTLERVADPSVQLLNVANDRIISAHTEECPEIIDEDNGSAHSGDLTISSNSVSSASVRNDPVSDGVQPDPNRQAELQLEGAPEVHGLTRTLRHRHVPVRFIPGGSPRETSFDSDGYPKE
ncbi:hypothetical protein Pmar_PMAR010922 [Perkinsus marinus ATCC 50983]|uniref:Uncharacterized protein n=1 Tax=Perkinsus marinus (strain ATCC 50983 / TXsc) TaxID=423536 RepID=C5LUC4_PERM5|nr:hypothetical protein Pmar_PMAR010922 [Perkinsus marinus ATCC 50983]EEQ99657.1 hypothetical protein Pmar_PMAR010922 [Perkinsus marinus ATCC 50983]|eukprot:XP_002766940.1 hypothetical protein Pmar_PMAR010922 [Perkinsus marinus ATCC 50983]